MTPPPMVTDSEAAEWAASPTMGKDSQEARLLRDRERTLGLLEKVADLNYGAFALQVDARKLLKEAGRNA